MASSYPKQVLFKAREALIGLEMTELSSFFFLQVFLNAFKKKQAAS